MGKPTLRVIVAYGLLALICANGSPYLPALPATIALGTAILFGVMCLFAAVDWWIYTANSERIRVHSAMQHTESVRKLELLRELNREQLFALLHAYDTQAILGEVLPEVVPINGEDVEYLFAREFVEQAFWLPEIRTWSDGSKRRRWAQAMTEDAIRHGYAIAGTGNKPAAWVSEAARLECAKKWGIEV